MSGADIEAFSSRHTARSQYFIVRFGAATSSNPRFAVIVAKKVDQRATQRHTLKRRAQAILRGAQSGGRDAVITILPPAAALPKAAFREEFLKIFKH